ncbi:hypothetical protein [Azospirillum rugosum]|uniref:Uncharacterized protein n=1 Tax=Azospirillum rugosum TaxID=416170 RepID=A0ABS4SI73_9PROT|nr:hypothetical protein [Azospirillum rugosum]MBP2292277.1 hypothetical protein [Azospirillum rugosum]MDQ0526036.1 hypothetical protein [Azospirillum rugosum]
MNDRILPTPRNPFTEAHKEELEENARKIEKGQGEIKPRKDEGSGDGKPK